MMVNKGNIPTCQNGHGESSKVRISALVMMCSPLALFGREGASRSREQQQLFLG